MSYLVLNDICKKYDKKNNNYAVKDFNLNIKREEFIVFVGPSGCGKSTTLRMIAGLEEISSGELILDEKTINNEEAKNRDMAMVFQNYALYPHMTVYKNMSFALEMQKVDKDVIDEKIKSTASLLGLSEYLETKPKSLSGGQRQRVALGRAIVRDPKVFLMDEPLSNLDAKLRASMRDEIIKLHKKLKATTIYVTHDQVEAMTMADRIVVMKDGIIQQIGTPINLYNYPANVFVASFIGTPHMNFIDMLFDGKNLIKGNNIFKLQEHQIEMLIKKGYKDKQIIVGLRPEHIHANEPNEKSCMMEIKIDRSELHGKEYICYGKTSDTNIIFSYPETLDLNLEETMSLYVVIDKLHFFDRDNQEVINDEN